MKRFKIVGLCLVVVFALSAIMVSGAQAGTMGLCVKASKVGKVYKGHFTDKLCTKAATAEEIEKGGKTNKYEFQEAANLPFTSAGGVAALKGATGTISCESNTDVGKFINGKLNEDVFTFHGCTLSTTGGKCQNKAPGEIVTNVLTSHLIDHGEKGDSGKEPAEGEAWTEFEGTGGAPLAEFECEPGIKIKVTGSVSGTIGPVNVQTKAGKVNAKSESKDKFSFTVDFAEKVGEQDLSAEACGALVKELSGMECITGPSVQEGSGGLILTAKKYEIKT